MKNIIYHRLAKHHLFVDDLLARPDSLESARKIVHELQNLMSACGFEQRKWSCTHPEVLSDFPNIPKINISSHSFDDESTQTFLGSIWDLNENSFKVRAVLSDKASTKRHAINHHTHLQSSGVCLYLNYNFKDYSSRPVKGRA
ncbi:hypothetical protein TNCV_1745761 [Trichonephila clavipes]|nr:hypothetical protein TNCV_1745761 [Trichonephila clavipes]